MARAALRRASDRLLGGRAANFRHRCGPRQPGTWVLPRRSRERFDAGYRGGFFSGRAVPGQLIIDQPSDPICLIRSNAALDSDVAPWMRTPLAHTGWGHTLGGGGQHLGSAPPHPGMPPVVPNTDPYYVGYGHIISIYYTPPPPNLRNLKNN